MRTRNIVVGGGPTAVAVGMSLRASKHGVTMVLRDKVAVDSYKVPGAFFDLNSALHKVAVPRDDAFSICHTSSIPSLRKDFDQLRSIFVCTNSYNATVDSAAVASTVNELLSVAQEMPPTQPRNVPADSAALRLEPGLVHSPIPVVLMCHGLSKDAISPYRCLKEALSRHGKTEAQLFVGSGTFTPSEWTQSSVAIISQQQSGSAATLPPALCALSFAPSSKCSFQAMGILEKLFAHETVSFATFAGADHAETASIVNACQVAVAVGAGMVSNASPGSLSAMGVYLHNAVLSMRDVVRQLQQCDGNGPTTEGDATRSRVVELPSDVISQLMVRCFNNASSEYQYGRKVDFFGKPSEAFNAIFRRESDKLKSLQETMEGLQIFFANASIDSPFFQLIFQGFYGERSSSCAGTQLLNPLKRQRSALEEKPWSDQAKILCTEIQKVDAALEIGSAAEFDRARNGLENAVMNRRTAAVNTNVSTQSTQRSL
jgi:hypothetical protein